MTGGRVQVGLDVFVVVRAQYGNVLARDSGWIGVLVHVGSRLKKTYDHIARLDNTAGELFYVAVIDVALPLRYGDSLLTKIAAVQQEILSCVATRITWYVTTSPDLSQLLQSPCPAVETYSQ